MRVYSWTAVREAAAVRNHLWIKREIGVNEGHGIEHVAQISGPFSIRHEFPGMGLVDDKVVGLRNRNSGRGSTSSAGIGKNEVAGGPESRRDS